MNQSNSGSPSRSMTRHKPAHRATSGSDGRVQRVAVSAFAVAVSATGLSATVAHASQHSHGVASKAHTHTTTAKSAAKAAAAGTGQHAATPSGRHSADFAGYSAAAPAAGGSPTSSEAAPTASDSASPSSSGDASASPTASGGASQAPSSNSRYGVWLNYNSAYTSTDEIRQAAGKYSSVVLNPVSTDGAKALHSADPDVKIYAYMDLSSVRKYDGDKGVVGVSYDEAVKNDWLAKDSSGNPIEWNGYPGHYMAKVWDPGYQAAWAARAQQVLGEGFDGVMADNAMSTLSHYSSAVLSGTSSAAETDKQIQAGVKALISSAGTAVDSKGGALIPNISDGRLSKNTWTSESAYGGGMEENFMSWSSTSTNQPTVWDFADGGWDDQTSLISTGPKSLAVTFIDAGDTRTALYGFSSFLMKADQGDGWTARTRGSQNDATAAIPEQTIPLGAPQGDATKESNGARVRSFKGGWAAVNPTQTPVTVTAPAGTVDTSGKEIGTVTLQPMSGVVGESASAR